jgi:hypothetical protein
MKIWEVLILILSITVFAGCSDPELPKAKSKLLDPKGGFTLYISNQSYAIDPVDVRVQIDGALVVSDYFEVGTQHSFRSFQLSLSKGKHKIRIWSVKGDAELSREFELKDQDIGVVTYWYYPKSTPKKFDFNIQKRPLRIE